MTCGRRTRSIRLRQRSFGAFCRVNGGGKGDIGVLLDR